MKEDDGHGNHKHDEEEEDESKGEGVRRMAAGGPTQETDMLIFPRKNAWQ